MIVNLSMARGLPLQSIVRNTAILLGLTLAAQAHDVITTSITFDKEIIRIFQARCASCHREGGTAFSLANYQDARPWAQAIKEEVLSRRMPPWGAVKGFGEFRNDGALSNEQIETILGWIDGGVPEGEQSTLPAADAAVPIWTASEKPSIVVSTNGYVVTRAMQLDGLQPIAVPARSSMKITAVLPDGTVEALVWIHHYQEKYAHPYLLESPLALPAGTRIEGIATGAKIGLLLTRK